MWKRLITLTACAFAAVGLASSTPPARSAPTRPLDIYFVDVEGGAATLMVTPAGESVLVDSGWPREDGRDAKRIEQAARYVAGLTQIDHYVSTHWHTDHYGSIEQLTKLMPVKHFWDRGIPATAEDGAADFPTLIAAYKRASGGTSRPLKPGDTIPLRTRNVSLKVVSGNGKVIGEGNKGLPISCAQHPAAPVPDESDNMRSIGLMLRYGKFGFLNLGDLTWNIEHKLVCPKNRIGQVDLWQVTHHGWEASGNPALVEALRPGVAVIVNGPRKGASPRTYSTLKKSTARDAVYQLHRNVTTGPEDNAPPERIANLEENCAGEFIRVSVNPQTGRYTVYKGAGQALQSYPIR